MRAGHCCCCPLLASPGGWRAGGEGGGGAGETVGRWAAGQQVFCCTGKNYKWSMGELACWYHLIECVQTACGFETRHIVGPDVQLSDAFFQFTPDFSILLRLDDSYADSCTQHIACRLEQVNLHPQVCNNPSSVLRRQDMASRPGSGC